MTFGPGFAARPGAAPAAKTSAAATSADATPLPITSNTMAGSLPAFKRNLGNVASDPGGPYDDGYCRQPSIVFRTGGGVMSQATTAFRLR